MNATSATSSGRTHDAVPRGNLGSWSNGHVDLASTVTRDSCISAGQPGEPVRKRPELDHRSAYRSDRELLMELVRS